MPKPPTKTRPAQSPTAAPAEVSRRSAAAGATAKEVQANKSATIEYVNIGLMILALGIASFVPFELFLFSYAVLGPMHYLTEISWIHDRKFFAPRPTDWIPLVLCAVLITLGNPSVVGGKIEGWLNALRLSGRGLGELLASIHWDITFLAFGMALVFVLTDRRWLRFIALAMLALGAILFHLGDAEDGSGLYFKLFSVYLPTLVHVFVFTGIFILAGALKRQSRAGYLSLAVFLSCGFLAMWLPNFAGAPTDGAPSKFWSGFSSLSLSTLQDIMGYEPKDLVGMNVYSSDLALRLVRFLAFAYTYHYLNWFSKTSIIQWHAVSKVRLAVVAVAWFASVGLYAMSYDLGLRWLFLLSFCHVVLEFPLNHRSMMEVGLELSRRLVRA